MTFDRRKQRRVSVHLTAEGTRSRSGEYVPGAVTVTELWASRIEAASDYTLGQDGLWTERSRTYVFRWTPELAAHPLARIRIVDEASREWFPMSRFEDGDRRRYLSFRVSDPDPRSN